MGYNIKSINGMTLKKLGSFLEKGTAFGAKFSPSEFIYLFEEFLTQTLEATEQVNKFNSRLEYPTLVLKNIFIIYSNNKNQINTEGDVIVYLTKNDKTIAQTFRLEFDARDYIIRAIKNGYSAKLVDNRFKKQKVKLFDR